MVRAYQQKEITQFSVSKRLCLYGKLHTSLHSIVHMIKKQQRDVLMIREIDNFTHFKHFLHNTFVTHWVKIKKIKNYANEQR